MNKKQLSLVIALAIIISLAVIQFVGCPIRAITGIPCPACGISRATFHALMGDMQEAFSYHPIFPLIYLMLFSVPVYFILKRISKYNWNLPFTLFYILSTLVVIVTYVFRLINGMIK